MAVRKQELLSWFKAQFGNPEVDMVEDASDMYARHICLGGNNIELLQKQTFVFNTEEGQIPMDYYHCPKCGKLIINKNFI